MGMLTSAKSLTIHIRLTKYKYQTVLCFEEYRSQLPISDMLQYLDIYPIDLPARYANKFMCAETIYLLIK